MNLVANLRPTEARSEVGIPSRLSGLIHNTLTKDERIPAYDRPTPRPLDHSKALLSLPCGSEFDNNSTTTPAVPGGT
jgi:hypothetical protein